MSRTPRSDDTVPCFGIDLGTTASAIGRVVDGKPELAALDGDTLTPSAVFYGADGDVVVGRAALAFIQHQPERVVQSSKRDMGTATTYAIGERAVSPTEVATDILRFLVDGAEQHFGERPQRVVITVPAWFTQAQRQATRDAGRAAGLDVVRILNEPTAAALAHAHGQPRQRRVLVYDFGGGTFDVSLVTQDGPILEVAASHGDLHLGGDDVDAALTALVLDQTRETDATLASAIEGSPHAMASLREGVQRAKHTMCTQATAELVLPDLVEVAGVSRGIDTVLEREDLEDIVLPLFLRTTEAIDRVLSDAGHTPAEIDELLLVGGSSSLPQVWKGLRMRYGLQGDASLPPRHAVALGATVQAAMIDGGRIDSVLVDVAPFALSIGMTAGGAPGFPSHFVCEVITPRNTPLPSCHTHLVRTGHPRQPRIRLPVYQGSHPDPRQNQFLGEIVMEELPPAPFDQLFRSIAVEVRHDLDGTVDITVIDQLTGLTAAGRIIRDGHEQTERAEAWVRYAEEHDLLLGDPFELSIRPDEDPKQAADPRVEAAQAVFQAVLAAADALRAEHAGVADTLIQHATTGSLAATMARTTDVLQHQTAVEDIMFEEGIYL